MDSTLLFCRQGTPLVPGTLQGLVTPLVQGVQVTLQSLVVTPQHLVVTLPLEGEQATLVRITL